MICTYGIGVAAARVLDSDSGIDPVAFIPSGWCHRGGIHWRSDVSDPRFDPVVESSAAQGILCCSRLALATLDAGDWNVTKAKGLWLEAARDQFKTFRVKDFDKWSPPLACEARAARCI